MYPVTTRSAAKTINSKIVFTYDSNGNRIAKTVTTGGASPTTTQIKDIYQGGRIAYETDGANTILATFAYDAAGQPTSVQVGSDPSTAPRYYYVYNTHGDVVALVDSSGNSVAVYDYDAFGNVTINTEHFTNGWHNPYLYDGKDRVRYDAETGLYWMSVRAYDPMLGRFISRDPLGRVPLMGLSTQPYVYGDNNPLRYNDPSGQLLISDEFEGGRYAQTDAGVAPQIEARMHPITPVWFVPSPFTSHHSALALIPTLGAVGIDNGTPSQPANTTANPASFLDPTDLVTNCRSGDDYAGWCFRYYNSFADNHLWLKGVNDFAAEADFFYGNVSLPLLPGGLLYGNGVGFLAAKSHKFILDGGLSVALGSGIASGGFGFGVLLTAGTPLDSQTDSFLSGWGGSVNLNSELGGLSMLYSKSSKGWALVFASPGSSEEFSAGGSWGGCLFHC